MSFKAKFKVSGKELNVLECNYTLRQETDPTGRPSSVTRGGKIHLTVESTDDPELFEWMCNNFERKDGSIVFTKAESDAVLKELKFKEGYLVDFDERFLSTGSSPMTIRITISAKEIAMGSGVHINEWV